MLKILRGNRGNGAVAVSRRHTQWFSAQMLNSRLQHHLGKAKQRMGNQILPYEAVT